MRPFDGSRGDVMATYFIFGHSASARPAQIG
jgi:hypothetical protein